MVSAEQYGSRDLLSPSPLPQSLPRCLCVMIKVRDWVEILMSPMILLGFLQQTLCGFFCPASRLPSNFSSGGGCQDFMTVWLSYPSRWLALIYAEINVQNLICLIAPETWGVRPKKKKKILIYSLLQGPGCDVTTHFIILLGLKACFSVPRYLCISKLGCLV